MLLMAVAVPTVRAADDTNPPPKVHWDSVASADLMAETVQGRGKADTRALFEAFRTMARSGACPDCAPGLAEPMERLAPLSGVHEYPSRVKCATLPWHTMKSALLGEGQTVSTEAGAEASPKEMALIGESRIADILANVLFPFWLAEDVDPWPE